MIGFSGTFALTESSVGVYLILEPLTHRGTSRRGSGGWIVGARPRLVGSKPGAHNPLGWREV